MSRLIIPILILSLIDIYVFKGLHLLLKNMESPWKYIVEVAYGILSVVMLYQIYHIFSHWNEFRISQPGMVRFWLGIFFVLIFAKLGFTVFHLADDLFWLGKKIVSLVQPDTLELVGMPITRGKFITQLGLGISGLLLGAYSYGVIKGRYSFRILKERIQFDNLPKAFNGLRIVQISDLHLGSFVDDFEEVSRVIPMINEMQPDLILFTGDLVNSHSDEAEPWIEIFSKLKAKHGKYSIFGNHDYCDYGNYSKEEKKKSVSRLKEIHGEMGFRLLEDEHEFLTLEDEKIALVGTHNWGRGFHKVGDLDKALDGLDEGYFKILMSHDPTLWEEKVKDKKSIDLTLSGHTHGMQMGVEVPSLGIKWSPVKYVYKRWAGLYKVGENHLYINRGLGFLGFPGRVGIAPEITLLELSTKES